MLNVTCWMNYPAFYQGDLYRALVASGEVDLQVIYAKTLPEDRLRLGWEEDLKGYPCLFVNKNRPLLDAMRLAWKGRNRIHVVNGLWAEPSFAAAIVALAAAGSVYAIYSEASDPTVSRSVNKTLLRSWFGRRFGSKATAFFPISQLAVDFYRRLCAPGPAMYPFGYFRSRARWADGSKYLRREQKIEVVFAGQFTHRKGIDLLLEAIQPLFHDYPNMVLTLIGNGDLRGALETKAEAMGIKDSVVFEGVLTPDKVPPRLAVADLLALPSRWDGWGVVVNEAFSMGVPVIVSDRCGAADLVRNGINGYVFRSGDVADLRARLSDFLSRRADWPSFRANAAATGEKISTEEIAPYLIKCLKHMTGLLDEKPAPPWTQLEVVQSAG